MLNLKKVLLASVILGIAANPVFAKEPKQESEFKKWIKYNYEAEHYQQDGLKLVDPKGDAYLIRQPAWRCALTPGKACSVFSLTNFLYCWTSCKTSRCLVF